MTHKALILAASVVACLVITQITNGIDYYFREQLNTYEELNWTYGNRYFIEDDAWIDDGDVLDIDAGVEAFFNQNAGLEIIDGSIIAVGTESQLITFDSYGGYGNEGIRFNCSTAQNACEGIFEFCDIEEIGNDGIGAIYSTTIPAAGLTIRLLNTLINESPDWAVKIPEGYSDVLDIERCFIFGNGNGIMAHAATENVTIIGDTIQTWWPGLGGDGIGLQLEGEYNEALICNNWINEVNIGIDLSGVTQGSGSVSIRNNVIDYGTDEGSIGMKFSAAAEAPFTRNNIITHWETGISGPSGAQVEYTCLYANTNNFQNGASAGTGTFIGDPKFVSDELDYHLHYTSPCINTGDPDEDFNDPSPDNSRNDMGIYGGPYAWPGFYAVIPDDATDFDRTLKGDYYSVREDIIVRDGWELIIEPHNLLEFDADKGIEVESGGKLIAEGGIGEDFITLMSFPEEDRWNGITLEDGCDVSTVLKYIIIDHTKNGIICENDVLNDAIEYCHITDCQSDPASSKGIYLNYCDTDVSHCYFEDCFIGIGMNHSNSTVDSNTIVVDDYGIYVRDGSTFEINWNDLTTDHENNYGIYMVDGSGWLIGNEIEAVTKGIYLENSDPKLDTNEVDNCWMGLHLISGSQPVMTFTGFHAANRFQDCDSNEVFITGYLYPLIEDGHNDLVNNEDFHRYTIYSTVNPSTTPYSYDVGGNYWNLFSYNAIRAVIYPPDEPGYTISVSSWDNSPNTASFEEDLIAVGVAMEVQNQYSQAYAYYQSLIANYPNNPVAIPALRRMFCCAGVLDNYTDLYDDYTQMVSSITAPQNWFHMRRMMGHALRAGVSFDDALELFNGLLDSVATLTDSVFVLMDIENTLFDQLQGGGPGISSFSSLFSEYMNRMQELRLILEAPHANQSAQEKYIPTNVKLESAHPNPFNSRTTLIFEIPQSASVNLTIYDISGRQVATLVNERREAGRYQVTFNSLNLASGIYFCRLQVGNHIVTRKLVLLK